MGKKAKRVIKDCVFTNLFSNKNYRIKLYQALHPEDKDIYAEDIRIVTLENVLVDDIYNDLGFMVGTSY